MLFFRAGLLVYAAHNSNDFKKDHFIGAVRKWSWINDGLQPVRV